MAKIDQHKNIFGWFAYGDLYSHVVNKATDNSHFVEIGALLGKSSFFMAASIEASKKNIKFDVIDTWKGSIEHQKGSDFEIAEVVNGTLYETFLNNMKDVEDYYTPIRIPSVEASKLYDDQSLDFVLIDGAHDYDSVLEDISVWLPKVKPGGILAGDDYSLDHPEVVKAVNDYFNIKTHEPFERIRFNDKTWWVTI